MDVRNCRLCGKRDCTCIADADAAAEIWRTVSRKNGRAAISLLAVELLATNVHVWLPHNVLVGTIVDMADMQLRSKRALVRWRMRRETKRWISQRHVRYKA